MALLIGNDSYVSPQLRLNCCVNDVLAMRALLLRLGFTCAPSVLNATLHEMQVAFDVFHRSLQPNDIVIIYFSGHGEQQDGINYLLPTHGSSVSLSEWITKLNQENKNLLNILFLDCCRADTSVATFPHAVPMSQPQIPSNRPVEVPRDGNFLVLYACDPDTVAFEDNNARHGNLTRSLLKIMETTAVHEHILRFTGMVGDDLKSKAKEAQRSWSHRTESDKAWAISLAQPPALAASAAATAATPAAGAVAAPAAAAAALPLDTSFVASTKEIESVASMDIGD